jgi:6-phosphogluconolactonase
MNPIRTRALTMALGAATLGVVGLGASGTASATTANFSFPGFGQKAVYVSTNSTTANAVEAFAAQGNGSLVQIGTYPTGGTGNGSSGFSQGSVTLDQQTGSLFVVNAGSGQVSDFAVQPNGGLVLRDTVASGGTEPISVASVGNLVEVLNAAGTPNVTGFVATPAGLSPIAGGSQPLSAAASGPEDVVISPDRGYVVVTEKVSDSIDTFAIGANWSLSPAVTSPSDTPLAFAAVFTRFGQLLVADDGANGTSATSSYRVNSDGTLTSTQPSLPDAQTAACWISLDRNGDFFVSNAGSATMGSYELLPDGRLAFLGNTSAGSGAHPLDSAVSSDGHDLYVLDGNLNQISVFAVGQDAQLTAVGAQAVPAGSAGVAAS